MGVTDVQANEKEVEMEEVDHRDENEEQLEPCWWRTVSL